MNARELQEAGEKLFGSQWRAPLARALDISVVTMWRYTKKDRVPKAIALAIKALLSAQPDDQPHSRPS